MGNQALQEQLLGELKKLSEETAPTSETAPPRALPWQQVYAWSPPEPSPSSSKSKHALGSAKKQSDESTYSSRNADNDGDRIRNRDDRFPNDPRTWRDSDQDGVGDALDHFPKDPSEWFDSDADGSGDNTDKEFTGPARKMSVDRHIGDGTYGQHAG